MHSEEDKRNLWLDSPIYKSLVEEATEDYNTRSQ